MLTPSQGTCIAWHVYVAESSTDLLCVCRDGDLGKAKLYATELVRDSEDLMKALQNSSTFYAARTFDGIIDLATEIGTLYNTTCMVCFRNMSQNHAPALKVSKYHVCCQHQHVAM